MSSRKPVQNVEITIDGQLRQVPQESTLVQACQDAGIDVPTLCFLQGMTPANACRICVVELEGSRVLVPACSRQVERGMIVHTESERVRLARRLVMEFLASSVDLSLSETAQEYARRYGAHPERFEAGVGPPPATVAQSVKVDNDLYVRDLSRCILCYRCVDACGEEAQNTFAISVAGRGFDARIATQFDHPLPDSACVFCGNCIGVCPTGALMFKSEHDLRKQGRWDESSQALTETICPYCGVGCALTLHVQDNRIVKVTSPPDNSVTRGHLCIKGRFGFEFVQESEEKS
ncbi:MAG: 2Fe-2S iron-sulfur cluster-binding protein [Acidobacteria bacterium]|nr:2Fe-2S iron-sulfur cluster-binding protein [Acidobacteriota bacterium]MCI0566837.1 2Fe-2S iron-sulfur cluster-binding protein [Acidobacteriota bacterium]